MSQALPERPEEAALNELVWVHHPGLGSKPKRVTRGKLRILAGSGFEEADPPDGVEVTTLSRRESMTLPSTHEQPRPDPRPSGKSDQNKEA